MKDMTNEILKSVVAHADGMIAKHKTNVLVQCKNSVGVAEHGDHIETIQQEMEKMAWEAGGKTQSAPAQRMVDFVNGKTSNTLNDCSYIPGINSVPLHELLPPIIGNRLQEGFKTFGRKMKEYFTNDANILGVESRTSSPVRIPRNELLLSHPQVHNLYPCGEGAGYAGGIVSAAIDGIKCAEHC